jgi:hypothetical protein
MRVLRYIFFFFISTCSVFAQLDISKLRGYVPVNKGGTGRTSLYSYRLLVGTGTKAVTSLSAGTAGQVLVSGGSAANPTWSTASWPTISGLSGKFVQSDGTNLDTSAYKLPLTITQGDMLYAANSDSIAKLPKNTGISYVLMNTGTNNNPAWGLVDLTYGVTNYVLVANGGTGATSLTDHAVLLGSNTGPISTTGTGTAYQHLKSGGASADPGWTTATYPDTVVKGAFAYGSANNVWGNLAPGVQGKIIRMGASSVPAWTTAKYPGTTTINQILYSPSGDSIGGITTAANSILRTTAGGVPYLSTSLPDGISFESIKLGQGISDNYGNVKMYIYNNSGATLEAGDVCVWNDTPIEVVADAALASSMTIADDLSDENSGFTLEVVLTGTADAGDSVCVYGVNAESHDSVTVLLTASLNAKVTITSTDKTELIHWSKVDSVKFNADAVADGASAATVNAYGTTSVGLCDGAGTDIAGVAYETILDNYKGYIVTYGICQATVDAATNPARPGTLLEGAADGDFVTDASATTSKNAARALESSSLDNFKILVFIDVM